MAGCGVTRPSKFYVLTPVEGSGSAGMNTPGPAIGLGPVTFPAYLDRPEIAHRSGDNQLHFAGTHRWAEPLDAGVSRVVAVNLAVLMSTTKVQIFPWRRDAIPEWAVRINVIQFAAQDKEAMLVAEWAISKPGQGESSARGINRLTTVLKGGEPEHVAGAYSELLLEFSEIIAAGLREEIDSRVAAGS